MRRKGERAPPAPTWRWEPGTPMAGSIASGSHWLDAWLGQLATPIPILARRSGIREERLLQLLRDEPTLDELAGLARAWRTTPADIAASIDAWRAR